MLVSAALLSAAPQPAAVSRAVSVGVGASGPRDAVTVGTAGRQFWHEVAVASAPGPIGAVVSDVAKADLQAMLQELQSRKVAFFRERAIHLSNSDRFQRMEAAEAAQWVLGQPAQFAAPLLVSLGEGTLMPVRTLGAVQALDALLGDGDAAALDRPRLASVMKDALKAGVTFGVHPPRDLGRTLDVPAFWAYEALAGHEAQAGSIVWQDGSRQEWLHNEQEALAQAYLQPPAGTTPSLEGIERPEILRAVQAADAQGISLMNVDRADVDVISPFDSWRQLRSPRGGVFLGLCNVPLTRADADGFPAAVARLQPYLAARREVFADLDDGQAHDLVERILYIPVEDRAMPVLDERAQPAELGRKGVGGPLRERAEELAALRASAKASGHYSEYEVSEKTGQMYDWLDGKRATLSRPDEQKAMLLDWIRACGTDGARDAAEFAWSTLSEMHPDPAGYAEAVAVFDSVLRSVGRVRPAREAAQAVSLPVQGTTSQERLATFQRLLALSSEEALPTYMAVAATCGADRRIVEQVTRFEALQSALINAIPKDLPLAETARTCFAFLDNGLRAGLFKEKDYDDALRAFIQAVVETGDLDRARVHMLQADLPCDGRVERGEQVVVIGGVRVPVRKTRG